MLTTQQLHLMTELQSTIQGLGSGVEKMADNLDYLLRELHPTNQAIVGNTMSAESPAPAPQATGQSERLQFVYGVSSNAVLGTLVPPLADTCRVALEMSTNVDWRAHEGLRSLTQQRINVQKGVSKTMDSKHLAQAHLNGKSAAVDLVPVIGGVLKWDWEACYKIAVWMDKAATRLGIAHNIKWGAIWDRTLADFGDSDTPAAYMRAVQDYSTRHPGKDFLDGPHYEWIGG